MKQKNKYMIFSNMKQQYLLVKIFILAKINVDEAEIDQSNLLKNLEEFSEKPRTRTRKRNY